MFCAQHPQVPARFRCDECNRLLCDECIEESHALLLCKVCGERAMPLHAGQPATTAALHKQRAVTAPYSFAQALFYPFRGTGLYCYLGALAFLLLIVGVSIVDAIGIATLVLSIIFLVLVVGLQFRIVRSTAEGDNELPDWPDFTDFGGLFRDFLTWVIIHIPLGTLITAYIVLTGVSVVFAKEPNYVHHFFIAVGLWFSAAFAVMAYGSAATFRRLKIFAVHHHIGGFFAAGSDAVTATNMVFGVGAATLIVTNLLDVIVPLVGGFLSSALDVYWMLTLPHLSGLVFRRHEAAMERLYWQQ